METILIADDQEIVRNGVKMIVESISEKYTIIEASTCADVKQVLFDCEIHFTILDLFLADGNIFSTIHRFIKQNNKNGILVFSMSAEKIYGRRLLKKGVRGFISKNAPIVELEKAIRCFLKGEIYLSQAMEKDLLDPIKANYQENPVHSLSDRELEAVEYITGGLNSGEIAAKMKLDITTVNAYRRRAFEKLAVQNTIELRDKFFMYKLQQ
jgi:two-component system, NarL family, invasion response regulator UvrY